LVLGAAQVDADLRVGEVVATADEDCVDLVVLAAGSQTDIIGLLRDFSQQRLVLRVQGFRLPLKVALADSVASVCSRSSMSEMLFKPPSTICK